MMTINDFKNYKNHQKKREYSDFFGLFILLLNCPLDLSNLELNKKPLSCSNFDPTTGSQHCSALFGLKR